MVTELSVNGFEGFDTMKVLIEAVGNGDASTDPEKMNDLYERAKKLETRT